MKEAGEYLQKLAVVTVFILLMPVILLAFLAFLVYHAGTIGWACGWWLVEMKVPERLERWRPGEHPED